MGQRSKPKVTRLRSQTHFSYIRTADLRVPFMRVAQKAFTLIVSRGCPAKTRQTPPNPPAKKFFRGLMGFCCFDILFPFCWREKRGGVWIKVPPKTKWSHDYKCKSKAQHDTWCVRRCCCPGVALPPPFTHFNTRTGMTATRFYWGTPVFGVRVEIWKK